MVATASQLQTAYDINPELAAKVVLVSQKLRIPDPAMLANVIEFESAGSWRPDIKNPSSGATGLIQFMRATATELNTSQSNLANMTAVQQMDYVEKYFKLPRIQSKGPLKTQADVYMAVFYPDAIGKGLDYTFNAAVQAANPGIKTAGDYVTFAQRKAKLLADESGSMFSSGLGNVFGKGLGIAGKAGLLLAGVGVFGYILWKV